MSFDQAMRMLPLRLRPGDDLRRALEAGLSREGCEAAFVLSGIGSLSHAALRLAGAQDNLSLREDLEVLTLSGSVAAGASHLHASVSRANGEVLGGHVGYGSIVRTTAEVLLGLLPGWRFTRERDAATGYDELTMRRIDQS
jgi:predicted DNA-binding protein with PD1-like motif